MSLPEAHLQRTALKQTPMILVFVVHVTVRLLGNVGRFTKINPSSNIFPLIQRSVELVVSKTVQTGAFDNCVERAVQSLLLKPHIMD